MYIVGARLNPDLLAPGVVALRRTNPDCWSRFSTLQSAQRPVRGQLGAFVAGAVSLEGADVASLLATDGAREVESFIDARSPERPQASISASGEPKTYRESFMASALCGFRAPLMDGMQNGEELSPSPVQTLRLSLRADQL